MELKGFNPDDPDIQSTGKNLKKILIFLVILLLIYIIFSVFSETDKKEIQPTRTTGQEWTVTKSTYIYYSPDFDSDTKGELAVGDIVTLPAGVISPECKTISEPGLSAVLCYLRAKRSGTEGWVLMKWVE